MKVLTVVGARPQFVKAAAVSRVLREDHEEVLVHTGQHYDEDMSDVFFEELSIPFPDTNLGVGSDTHGRQTGAMLAGLEAEIEDEDPDAVLVYGDTNSTLAAAIATSKMDPPLAHVEAGMRSGSDIPEETNRVLTDHAADLLFVPSPDAENNLDGEGITDGVHFSGDVGYDALLWARDRADTDVLSELGVANREFVLSTVHRDTNADDPDKLEAIVDALVSDPRPVVLPAHPRTVARLEEFGLYGRAERGLTLTEPVGYRQFVALLDAATVVATDSGGVQKEAFFLDTPCVTLREQTEWVETVESGWNTLVGADEGAIRTALSDATTPTEKPTPYGDGNAAERIVEVLSDVTRV
ncbi:UDP-N-acetylglucosamine 2-epimerase [Haladaptatus paucihalophilus DX253]|uniref:UDP-N-acetylglucosamine 2-epimerase n=1 Tax=Haladaptatus paucihalophilus DX253 TaxID=797209 RepID=E7QQ64_HALPU|nr:MULTISPECIES: UDP-N-acetylglucosamine 2-epimerase (non-hydrolyzing) [Haladaptatus]EFW93128.1 UDP-N-acetylglucosamine 2-epimerase [Haladaptatus paucihalophilus DX253]GKZ12525.1 UDP-N-acetyl glucosamine 2-epimerase [Haladaptatus sp. T7]SHK45641.1 UDP-N-acetylglucosamine 2-epimerase (non-hydrolysing) [Haladaptatus paucihalophilus DX253]